MSQKNTKSYDVFRYAVLAVAYLVSNLSENEMKRMKNVLLFGSAARFSASEESDIDIFFDVSAPKRFQLALRAKLNKAADEFSLTNTALGFKSRGVDNELSVKVGKLEEWELAKGMPSHGISLYSKHVSKPPESKAYMILSWTAIPLRNKGAFLNKIYGYKANNKRYPGLLEKTRGIKLGKAVIMVPAQSRDIFIDALEKYKVNYSRHDVWG